MAADSQLRAVVADDDAFARRVTKHALEAAGMTVVAEDTIADVDASGLWPGEVVTEISEAGRFWEAPDEDQDYLQHHPEGETCHFPRPGWKLPHRETAA